MDVLSESSNSERTKATVELKYIRPYRLLLCKSCAYCVLPHALDRHLKTIHQIPAASRESLIKRANNSDLAQYADAVTYPEPGAAPVPGLPISNGFSCGAEDCSYLCVTQKRMQAHWRTAHSNMCRAKGIENFSCHRVKLQTFFRSTNLRYFTVAQPKSQRDSQKSDLSNTSTISMSPSKLPGLDDNSSSSLEKLLIQQFYEHTYESLLPCNGTKKSWIEEILQVSKETNFLRYAILGLTANHVAYEHPDSRALYGSEASRYRQLAITTLSREIYDVGYDNFFAVFNFSRLMTVSCIAGVQLAKLENCQYASSAADSVLPPWIKLQQQGRALVWPLRGDGRITEAMHGPHQRLFAVNLMSEVGMSQNPYDSLLAGLEHALRGLPTNVDYEDCLDALHKLRIVWAVPYRESVNSFRDMALMWAVRVRTNYLELVQHRDPVALVIFAHYAVLWSFSESRYWYMEGHAKTLLFKIVQSLTWQWQPWISWPIEMIFGAI